MPVLRSNTHVPVRLLGSARSVPGSPVTNEEIHTLLYGKHFLTRMAEEKLDPGHAARRGFRERFWASTPGQEPRTDEAECLDLMESAAREALERAETGSDQIDLFVAFSTTPSRYTTSSAAIVGGRLGLRCATLEIRAGCASGVHALVVACSLLSLGGRRALVAGAEVLSKVLPKRAPLIYAAGDAGAAVVLSAQNAGGDSPEGLLAFELDSDGSHSSLMGVPGLLPPRKYEQEQERYRLQMSRESEIIARELWQLSPRRLLEDAALAPTDVDAYIPHQVNRDLLVVGSRAAGIADDRVVHTLERYANCGSVSVLVNLHEALTTGRIGSGSLVMLHAVGGGMAWGAALLRL